MKKAVALFSGGIDSTVMLWRLVSEGWRLILLSFNYHRRNPREIEAAQRIAQLCPHEESLTIDLPILRELFDFDHEVRARWEEKLNNPPTILIPYRNLIFYSLAAHVASQKEVEVVAGGHTLEDQTRLPDASTKYIKRLNETLDESLHKSAVRVYAPLIELDKTAVVRLGMRLGAPLELTWSCWAAMNEHCGQCPGCKARRRTFNAAGYADSTKYLDGQKVWL